MEYEKSQDVFGSDTSISTNKLIFKYESVCATREVFPSNFIGRNGIATYPMLIMMSSELTAMAGCMNV